MSTIDIVIRAVVDKHLPGGSLEERFNLKGVIKELVQHQAQVSGNVNPLNSDHQRLLNSFNTEYQKEIRRPIKVWVEPGNQDLAL